jgi:hypothetical protein
VSAETKEEAYKAIERDRKHLEKDAAERMEMLTDSLETLQATSSQESSVGHFVQE